MRWRTGPDGYGLVTKGLHWLTVALVAAQFAVGWSMDLEAGCDPRGEDRSGGDTSDRAEDRIDRLEELCKADADRLDLTAGDVRPAGAAPDPGAVDPRDGRHPAALAPLRRLPAWSDALSERDRRLVHWTERALMLLLLLVPLSGLLLVTTGNGDWLPLHIGAHLAFFVALAAHLYTNLRPRVLRRML